MSFKTGTANNDRRSFWDSTNVAAGARMLFGAFSLTTMCWVYPVSATGSSAVFGCYAGDDAGTYDGWQMGWQASSTKFYYFWLGNSLGTPQRFGSSLRPTGSWYHIALVYRHPDTTGELYVNGQLDATNVETIAMRLSVNAPTTSWGLEPDNFVGASGEYKIAYSRVFAGQLSQPEIAAEMMSRVPVSRRFTLLLDVPMSAIDTGTQVAGNAGPPVGIDWGYCRGRAYSVGTIATADDPLLPAVQVPVIREVLHSISIPPATLIAVTAIYGDSWNTATTPQTTSVTVANGDFLVICAAARNNANTFGSLSGGGLTYTQQTSASANASCPSTSIWTAPCGSAQTFTFSISRTAGSFNWGYVVMRFSGVSGVGAVSSVQDSVSGSEQYSFTTTMANSAVVAILNDKGAGSAGTWLTTSLTPFTPEGTTSAQGNYSGFYNLAPTIGAKTIGMFSPTGAASSISAIELKPVPALKSRVLNQAVKRGSYI